MIKQTAENGHYSGEKMNGQINFERSKLQKILGQAEKFLCCVLSMAVTLYMALILCVLPLYHTKGYTRIGTDKAEFFLWVGRNLGMLAAGTCVALLLMRAALRFGHDNQGKRQRKLLSTLSLTDVFALFYGAGAVISYVASDYQGTARWGAPGWYMGLYTQMLLVGSYFLISRFWNGNLWVLRAGFLVSSVVFVLGYLNRFGIYPVHMEGQNPSFLSTIGNSNWYCGYITTIVFGGIFLFWKKGGIWLALYSVVGFGALITQGSASGIVTLFVVLFVLFCFSVKSGERMCRFWKIMMLFGMVCAGTLCIRLFFPERITFSDEMMNLLTYSPAPIFLAICSPIGYLLTSVSVRRGRYSQKKAEGFMKAAIVCLAGAAAVFAGLLAVNTAVPGSIGGLSEMQIFTFDDSWGSSRGATWRAGLLCFAEQDFLHKLVGAGPDCMSAFLYRDGSQGLLFWVKQIFGEATLTNAHNEWVTILVNMGILGAVAYVGMVTGSIVRYTNRKNLGAVTGMAGFCLLAYTVNNLFSFQTVINASVLFVLWGAGEASFGKGTLSECEKSPKIQ